MSMQETIDDIRAKCEDAQNQLEFVKTLVGKAEDDKWPLADPGYTMLKTMAQTAADLAVTLAQTLRAAIPDP